LAIIIAGMKYITAGGDPKKAETGKKAVLYSVYGIVLVVLVIELITLTVTEVRKIVGNKLPDPSQTKRIISPNIGGPLATINDVINRSGGLIWSIIRLAVYYSEFVAAFYILYASFLYMTSFGDDSKAESAKKTLIWAVIGLAFIISVNTLLSVFAGVLL